jgi:hypothetical protein
MKNRMIGLIGAGALLALAGCGGEGGKADANVADASAPAGNSYDVSNDIMPDMNSSPPVDDVIVTNTERPR